MTEEPLFLALGTILRRSAAGQRSDIVSNPPTRLVGQQAAYCARGVVGSILQVIYVARLT